MTEEELTLYIDLARAQLPLPSEHAHDLIWIPIQLKEKRPGFRDGSQRDYFFVAPFSLQHHKVYFKKNMVAGVAIGWEFHSFVEFPDQAGRKE